MTVIYTRSFKEMSPGRVQETVGESRVEWNLQNTLSKASVIVVRSLVSMLQNSQGETSPDHRALDTRLKRSGCVL